MWDSPGETADDGEEIVPVEPPAVEPPAPVPHVPWRSASLPSPVVGPSPTVERPQGGSDRPNTSPTFATPSPVGSSPALDRPAVQPSQPRLDPTPPVPLIIATPSDPLVEQGSTSRFASPGPGAGLSTTSPGGSYPPFSTPPAGRAPGRRIWPLALLALLTVAASGVVSWLVADSVTDDAAVAPVEVGLDGAGSTDVDTNSVEPVSNTVEPPRVESAPIILTDEPFADAAELIAPSVVQLELDDGLGSGVIIDETGTILTAAHVVGSNTTVRVRLYDGSVVDGTVLGTHDLTDVAVVEIDGEGLDLRAAPLADVDDVRVGQLAVAVGSPFGFEQTVTAGIISGVDRVVNNVSMVQTDAPINPGNSGGPLIDLQGRVVGINDLIFTQSGSSAGVGFAISIDLAMIVADQIVAGEEVQLALLGVQTTSTSDGRAGALIDEVVADSAAEAAGLEAGDLVVAVDGEPTPSGTQLRAQVIDNPPGTSITLDVIRDGQRLQIIATLGSAG